MFQLSGRIRAAKRVRQFSQAYREEVVRFEEKLRGQKCVVLPTDHHSSCSEREHHATMNEVINGSIGFIYNNSSNGSTIDIYGALADDADQKFVRFREESRFWIQRVLLPLIGTVGIFGNIATILVLTRRGMRSSTNTYLTALAVADLIYLICVLWLSLRHYPNVNDNPTWSFIYSHVWPYSLWLADATTNTSVWLAVTFTVERCIAIAYPIKRRLLCKVPRAKKVIFWVYVICFTTTMTTPFEWTVEKKMNPTTNSSIFQIASSHLGKEKTYRTIYYWFTSIAFALLPLTLLIIFNSYLIHSFRKSKKFSHRMAAQKKISEREEKATTRELKITSTLITVVILFIVCQLPTAATLIYEIFYGTKMTPPNEEAVLRALGNIFNCLVALNAACNFILYCALSDKYRRTFMLTFFPCLYQPPSSEHSNIPLFPREVQGPNEAQFKSRRPYSNSNRGRPTSTPLKSNRVSTYRFCPRLQEMPSASMITRHKTDSYITVDLPVISENSPASESFTKSNSSRIVIIHKYSAIFTTSPCSEHHQPRQSLVKRNTNAFKNSRPIEPTSREMSSWPNIIKPYYPSITIPLDGADSGNHIMRWSGIKELVTSFSV